MKNQKGISLLKLIIIIVVILFVLFLLFGGSNDNSSNITKEDRSTYIAKCTTIDYNSLARNPNQYKGQNFVFTGEVIQVINNERNSNQTALRVNVTPKKYTYSNETYYEDTILVYYKYSSSSESRILEKDIVTIYGQSTGTYTYESVLGSSVTVPSITAMYVDIK